MGLKFEHTLAIYSATGFFKIHEIIPNITGEIAVYARSYPWRPGAHSEQVAAIWGVHKAYML